MLWARATGRAAKSKPTKVAFGNVAAMDKKHRTAAERLIVPAVCILLLLAVLPYLNSLRNGFVWDDQQQIVMNPDLRPGAEWSNLFSTGVWGHLHHGAPGSNIYYRPLQMATYRMVIATVGRSPFALHVLSVTFAVVSVLLAFGLFWKITGQQERSVRGSCVVRRSSRSYRGRRLDLGAAGYWLHDLCIGRFLSFLSAYDGARPFQEGRAQKVRWLSWGLSLTCFVLALLWKETAAVVPLLVGAYVLLAASTGGNRHRLKEAAKWSLPYWLVLGGYLLLRLQVLGTIATSAAELAVVAIAARSHASLPDGGVLLEAGCAVRAECLSRLRAGDVGV